MSKGQFRMDRASGSRRRWRERLGPRGREFELPAHAVWLHWGFADGDISRLDFDITLHNDPGSDVGLYFAPFNGYVGGQLTYAGLQTDVQHPNGHRMGKGAIFSTWWTFDAADARTIEPDGFYQLGTHEGRFLGIRRPYRFGAGDYRFSLVRCPENRAPYDDGRGGNWIECRVAQSAPRNAASAAPVADEVVIGALRFERCDNSPPSFSSNFLSFLEVYAGADRYGEIQDWHIDVMAFANGERAHTLRIEYPSFPGDDVPNCDAWFDAERDRAHMRMGSDSVRTHAPGGVF